MNTKPVTYLANALSLQMFTEVPLQLTVQPLTPQEAKQLGSTAVSRVGHASTAALFSEALGYEIEVSRTSITLADGDRLLVGQYVGPRLPEGATTLPPGARIRWVLVTWTVGAEAALA
jgi:hypothetical protein